MAPVTLLDGAMGTELARRGVSTPAPQWSASALDTSPEVIESIHRDYACAGATVHSANTFRTDRWSLRDVPSMAGRWRQLTDRAVGIARSAVPASHNIAGSLSPLEDCYSPERVPEDKICRLEHRRFADALAEAGVDLILCETFTSAREALIAVESALATRLPVWLSLCRGPESEIFAPSDLLETARRAADLGVNALLVNCSPLTITADLVEQMTSLGPQVGCYANVGSPDEHDGWISEGEASPRAYGEGAANWLERGATILGGCCGTGPEHIKAVSAFLHRT